MSDVMVNLCWNPTKVKLYQCYSQSSFRGLPQRQGLCCHLQKVVAYERSHNRGPNFESQLKSFLKNNPSTNVSVNQNCIIQEHI